MEWVIKHFNELTTKELFEIYQLRVEVFVVEQECCYQDIDEYDLVSYHIMLRDHHKLIGYARVLPPHCTFESTSIGRVIVKERRKGYGTMVVLKAIETAKEKFKADIITIEAQVYARGLYEKCGFQQTSKEFLEDGILHIEMTLKF